MKYILIGVIIMTMGFQVTKKPQTPIKAKKVHIGRFDYYNKDTTSQLHIIHQECTECLDAWVGRGTVFLPDSVIKKIKAKCNEKGADYIPNERDLYLVDKANINIRDKLFCDSINYLYNWNYHYMITGKAIDMKGWGIVFRVDSFKLIDGKPDSLTY